MSSDFYALEQVLGRLAHSGEPLSAGQVWPAPFDVKQTAREMTVYVDLPGVDEDDIEIRPTGGTLQITGSRWFDHDDEDAEEYSQIARPFGTFRCFIPLNDHYDTHFMTAKHKRGVLKVRIPRAKENMR